MIDLPNELEINLTDFAEDGTVDEILDYLSDYLSDKYGYCHNGFNADITVKVSNVSWDVDDEEVEEQFSLFD